MHKIMHVDEKRLARKYNFRIFFVNLPAISVALALGAVVYIFIYKSPEPPPVFLYRAVFYSFYALSGYSFISCLIGTVISEIMIKAHKENTYIEISDSLMVVSQHMRTIFSDGKFKHYKKMWVMNLNDVEDAVCIKNHITITGKARYFYENRDWLKYKNNENGISFDRWWYDSNGGKFVSSVDLIDFYIFGERIVKRILHASDKVRERARRREEFRKHMLGIAAGIKTPTGVVTEKYKPRKR